MCEVSRNPVHQLRQPFCEQHLDRELRGGRSVAMGHFRVTSKVVVIYRYISIHYYYDSGHFQVAFGMGSQGSE